MLLVPTQFCHPSANYNVKIIRAYFSQIPFTAPIHTLTDELPPKDAGWQKLDVFIRRSITLYLSCSYILTWRIFVRNLLLGLDRALVSWTTVCMFQPPSHPSHCPACHHTSLRGETPVWMQTILPPPAAKLWPSSQHTILTRPRASL